MRRTRTLALIAATAVTATIVSLPGGAGATGEQLGVDSAPLMTLPNAEPALPVPAAEPVVALPAGPALSLPVAVPAPVPIPAVVAEIVQPAPSAAPPADDHMAELCAARAVFCQVDSSGRYLGS